MRAACPVSTLRVLRRRTVVLLGFSALAPPVACEPVAGPDAGPSAGCTTGAAPTVELGHGVDGAFVALAAAESVSIVVAPQGGYGMGVWARTTALEADDDSRATVHVATEIDGAEAGRFVLYQQPLPCVGGAGLATTVVLPLDPARYTSHETLLPLDGVAALLVVDIVDSNDAAGHGEQLVTLRVDE